MALPDIEEKETPADEASELFSNRQPLWHVVVLCVLTMFAYSIVWFFKNWKQLKQAAENPSQFDIDKLSPASQALMLSLRDVKPGLCTLALVLPIVQLWFLMRFFVIAVRLYPRSNWLCGKHPLASGFGITVLTVALLCLGSRPGLEYLLYLNAALPLAFIQYLLNEFWKEIEPSDRIMRQAFSATELVATILGGIMLGLVVTGIGLK